MHSKNDKLNARKKWVKSKVDSLGSMYTVLGQYGRSMAHGPWGLNRTVETTEIERSSMKLNGPRDSKWTVLKPKSERTKGMKLDGLKRSKLGLLQLSRVGEFSSPLCHCPLSRLFNLRTVHFNPLGAHFRPESKFLPTKVFFW